MMPSQEVAIRGIRRTPRTRTIAALLVVSLAWVVAFSGGAAWAYWHAGTVAGSNGSSAATSIGGGATPTATAAGTTVTVSWTASTLATGAAVSGYRVARYDAATLTAQTILSGCAGTVSSLTCVESAVPSGSWKYSITPVFATNWTGAESAKSATLVVDGVAPTNSLTATDISGGAHLVGNTVYYRGVDAGFFTLTNAVADAGSGPASSQYPALSGSRVGWVHVPSTVSTPTGGPFVSGVFAWSAGTVSEPAESVVGRDNAGNQVTTNLTFVNDSTPPGTGTISYPDGYQAGLSVAVTFTSGTDAGVGIGTRQLQRATATLSAGTCSGFGAFVNVGANNPTSVYADTQVANAACYKYQFVVTDRVGNQTIASSTSVAKVDYAGAVSATAGLLSQWRLGEATATLTAFDSFTGTSGSTLAAHSGEIGATWTHKTGGANARISNANRVHRSGSSGYAIEYSNATPASADYSVEADLVVMSAVTTDVIGVIGRMNTATNTFYMARWEAADTSWNLIKYTDGSREYLDFVVGQPALGVGDSYRLELEMHGSTLNLYVNGVLTVTATDTSLTAAGKAGIMDGADASSAAKLDTTGVHIDNFQVSQSTYPRVVDSKGSNTGDYANGVALGVAGALRGDANTAAQFDGVNDYVRMAGTTGLPVGAAVRSTEMWFKTSSSAKQVLFAYGSGASTQEYGLWIDAGGTTMTAWGFGVGNDKVFTMPSAVNNGNWHQVVQTYDGTSITIYIDGVALTPQLATRATTLDQWGFTIGAIVRTSDSNAGSLFAGSLDEVSFYTTVVNQATVTNHYLLGTAPAADLLGPSGGSVDATGLIGTGARYSNLTTLNLAFTKGTDASGVAASGNSLLRATAPLNNGVCGTYGSFTQVSGGADPVSPKSDAVDDQACYRYQYVVHDIVGNTTTYASADIKVDSTVPTAPTLAFSSFVNTYWPGSGTVVYYRSAAATGSFVATAASADPASGVVSYSFPAMGTNWTSTPGALGVDSYSWSGAPAAPGTKNVTATNNATGVSTGSPFTVTADDAPPSAGTLSYVNGSSGGATVSVSFTTGTDSGSGIGTRLVQRASAPLVGTTCGTYGAFSTVVGGTNPVSPLIDGVGVGCFKYQYVVADHVGNLQTTVSSSIVHSPYGARWTFDAGTGVTAADGAGNGNVGTLQSGASWVTGKVGSFALGLNGSTGYVDVPTVVVDTSQSYTAAAWVKLNTQVGFQTFLSVEGANISPFYLQSVDGRLGFAQRASDSTTAALTQVTGPVATVGTWYHVAGVYNSTAGTMELFVNGVSQGATAYTSGWKATGHTLIGRGKWAGAGVDFVNGAIDDARLYDRALTPSEIAALAAG